MTICIKNINILDLKHKLDKPMDILISGNKISAIGNFYDKKSNQTIDGSGLYVSSAFVDVDNRIDHNLDIFLNKGQDFLKQGISDIFVGQAGFSLAPFINSLPMSKYYDLPPGVNLQWRSIDQLFSFLNKKNLWVNVGSFIGFNNLYNFVSKRNNKELTNQEFKLVLKLLYDALENGAFGISINWEDIYNKRLSLLGLDEILDVLKKYSAVFSIFLSNPSNIFQTINQLFEIISKKEVKTLIGGYLRGSLTSEENILILKKVSNFYPNVFLTVSPYDASIFHFCDFLPEWERMKNLEEILKDINDWWMRKKILEELPDINPEKFLIILTNFKLRHQLNGKSLKELMDIYEIEDWRACLLNLMSDTKLRGIILYKDLNQDILTDALLSPSSLIVSGGFSFDNKKDVFTDFLNWSLGNQLMDIKKIIFKINYQPITFLGLKNRGIKEGCVANLVGFMIKDNKIQIKFVIINGRLCLMNNDFSQPAGVLIKNMLS